ncbi:bifunctional methylenetetrahydrofolate dehydrogenase/methenyltetrahydrofolate cyclohydrolase FolD [Sulfobacillus harzensis]|uniref:Bifunctional protein FolD n=1 Tax=Sulfobacillus harzensis TaxID=2729629 RepID=A0A7Y0L2F7_9FIRM|nr:bifunctional methylenetetrahydrofolate dehydrogenase/methenyltetrahydrofolate cyclohydrolase FolD [Sulfobacillus harzensis]NMP21150.1 bifunctional methylenetetrahydrofolate dehydrogenase/methenyltetrahydrofolate cyclohydrolase FolD [Sulfobacillus harzensis]
MSTILDGKAVAARIREGLKTEISQSGSEPGLAVVLVGNDPASEIYVRNKGKAARAVGMRSIEQRLPEDSRTEDVLAVVKELNEDPAVHGILVQLPLPQGVDRRRVIEAIRPEKDVDGLTQASQGALVEMTPGLRPCTPAGIMDLLDAYHVELAGRRAVVVGRSALVGLPTALLLLSRHATVSILHSRSEEPWRVAREADVLVAAAGRPRLVTRDWVKPGAVVVDVGIHRTENGLVGDVDRESLEGHAGALSPVPGGVGPMTIAELLKNTWTAYRGLR